MKLTKLQQKYIDQHTNPDDYIAFPVSIFETKKYKEWEKQEKLKNEKPI